MAISMQSGSFQMSVYVYWSYSFLYCFILDIALFLASISLVYESCIFTLYLIINR